MFVAQFLTTIITIVLLQVVDGSQSGLRHSLGKEQRTLVVSAQSTQDL